ncbi:unnamed protein product [Closterium sp. NIES-54]
MMQLRLLQRGARPGEITESLEVERLRFSLEELGSEETWFGLLAESGLPDMCLEIMVGDEEADEEDEEEEEEEDEEEEDEDDYDEEEDEEEEFDDLDEFDGENGRRRRRRRGRRGRRRERRIRDRWSRKNVDELQDMLLTVVDAASQHEQLVRVLGCLNNTSS